MKNFFLKFILFSCILVAVFYLLDIFISNSIKNSPSLAKGEYVVWNDIYKGNINSDMVIYGSSRAWVHINPQMLTNAFHISCYNMGIDGHGFLLQNFRHKELLRFNKRPQIIIHSVDMFTFTKSTGLYNYEQFLPYMLFDKHIENTTKNFDGFKLADFLIPSLRYYGKKRMMKEVFNPNLSTTGRIKGYMGKNKVWNNDFDDAKENLGSYNIKIDTSLVKDFENFLEECKKNNTLVILVYTPEYIDGQKFVRNRDAVIQVYKNLSVIYNIPFYDYSNDSISFQKNFFYNALHLNKEGSTLFTNLLITDFKKGNLIP
jgi:hypothetical protein